MAIRRQPRHPAGVQTWSNLTTESLRRCSLVSSSRAPTQPFCPMSNTMTTDTSKTQRSTVTRIMALVMVSLVVAGLTNACVGGSEGDRCNPAQTDHSECGGGLTCQQPATCAENYCCPTPASGSSNGYCNGTLCPAAPASDAGL